MKTNLLVASICCLLIGLPSCASTRTEDADTAPQSEQPAKAGVGLGYLRDGKDWYQLRVELELPVKHSEHGSLDRIELVAVARLWRYDRRLKAYDKPLDSGAAAKLGLAFEIDSPHRGELRILPTNGTERGGQSGLDGIRLRVAIAYTRAPDPSSPGDEIFIATALGEAISEDIGERQQTGALAKGKAIRRWRIGIDQSRTVSLEELPVLL